MNTLKVISDKPVNKLANLERHHSIVGDPAELISYHVWQSNQKSSDVLYTHSYSSAKTSK